jgi:site-specific DNA recombinase
VVHKLDRLARNMEDHVAIRALLRRRGVALVSITENVEETASGRLVEGIHALMAEFYSANLAAEARKGMAEKAKQGGWPHQAPIGYLNKRASLGGRRVAFIVPDPERADLVRSAFQLYAAGGHSVAQLTDELAERGLRGRGRCDRPEKPLAVSSVADLLANPVYAGMVQWQGVTYRANTSRWWMPIPSTASSSSSPQERCAVPASAATTMNSRGCCGAGCAAGGCR